MRKSGFTLMELVVYMAMIGIVVLVAGEAFSNSTKFRVRSQNMLKASEEAENVAATFKNDLEQMGAKSSMETTVAGSDDEFSVAHFSDIYMDPAQTDETLKDSSSFMFLPEKRAKTADLASMYFRKIRYKENGQYAAVEEVYWILTEGTLKRVCVIVDKASGVEDAPCASKGAGASDIAKVAVDMATNVTAFKVLPAIPHIRSNSTVLDNQTSQMFPPEGTDEFKFVSRYGVAGYNYLTSANNGSSVTLSGFTTNYDVSAGEIKSGSSVVNQAFAFQNTDDAGSWGTLCTKDGNHFTLDSAFEYEISFDIPYPSSSDQMQMFVPGKDHMSVGFRYVDGSRPEEIDDFLFYPPTTSGAGSVPRQMRFSVKHKIQNVCMAFTFANYSPLASNGTLTIQNLKLRKIASANYSFSEDTTWVPIQDKKNVKAFRLLLSIKRGGETGNIDMVIPTPSNGPRD